MDIRAELDTRITVRKREGGQGGVYSRLPSQEQERRRSQQAGIQTAGLEDQLPSGWNRVTRGVAWGLACGGDNVGSWLGMK